MNTDKYLEMARKQGISFLLLAIAVYYFYSENTRLNNRINTLSDESKATNAAYQVDHAAMRTIIESNTKVIEKNTAVFEVILKKKESD